MKTVIHSCTSNSFSGLEAYVLQLVDWQYRNGKSVVLFCREGSPIEKQARQKGIPLWTIGSQDRPGPLLWWKLRKSWNSWLSEGSCVLHMHAGGELLFHLPWLKIRDVSRLKKTILHFHIWINHEKNDPVHKFLYLGLDEVWTSSETARVHLATLLPISRDSIRVVGYGRDTKQLKLIREDSEVRKEVRDRFQIPSNSTLGICISRLEPIKGVRELFDAFVKVASKIPEAYLMIVGNESPNNPEAKEFADRLRESHQSLPSEIKKRLLLPGYVSPSEPLLVAADFYVLPTYEECMSLAMLDALILGVPVLGTNSGGTPSVVLPNETGDLFLPRNTESLAESLEKFFSNKETLKKLGKNAQLLGAKFDQEEIFQHIWEWYDL